MTPRERINDHPAPLHPSRRRASARTANVRSNSDSSHQNTFPKMQNKPTSDSAARVHPAAPSLSAPPPPRQANWRPLKSHSQITASAANANGSLQTTLSKLPRCSTLRSYPLHRPGQSR